jgi:hypothetical protein
MSTGKQELFSLRIGGACVGDLSTMRATVAALEVDPRVGDQASGSARDDQQLYQSVLLQAPRRRRRRAEDSLYLD